MIHIEFPLENRDALLSLHIGDRVEISGTVYTARDAAHKKMLDLINAGKPLPFDIKNQAIYYTGPCPAPEDKPIGSCGPTTSYRMNAFAPLMLSLGQAAIIGKGNMNEETLNACREHSAVYFAAAGGAGALMAACVTGCEVVAFPELLSEAVHRLTVKNMPLVVAFDAHGNNLFVEGREKYKK